MDRQCLVATLREALRDAEKRLQNKSDDLDEAIQANRNPSPTLYTQERVRLAAHAYRLAVEGRATALSRLNRFTMDNVVREELKRRAPRKDQGTKPTSLQQSA